MLRVNHVITVKTTRNIGQQLATVLSSERQSAINERTSQLDAQTIVSVCTMYVSPHHSKSCYVRRIGESLT